LFVHIIIQGSGVYVQPILNLVVDSMQVMCENRLVSDSDKKGGHRDPPYK